MRWLWLIPLGIAFIVAAALAWRAADERDVLRGVIFPTDGRPELVFYPSDGGLPMAVLVSSAPVYRVLEPTCVEMKAATVSLADAIAHPDAFGMSFELSMPSGPGGAPEIYRGVDRTTYGAVERIVIPKKIRRVSLLSERSQEPLCKLPQIRRERGLYQAAAIEDSEFRPAGWMNNSGWWGWHVQFGFDEKIRMGEWFKPGRLRMDARAACVEALGVLSPVGQYGHLGDGNQQFFITKVIWSAPHNSLDAATCAFPESAKRSSPPS